MQKAYLTAVFAFGVLIIFGFSSLDALSRVELSVPNTTIVKKNMVFPLKGQTVEPCANAYCVNV